MQITKHFFSDEFKCPCCGEANIRVDFVEKLQLLRNRFKAPIKITSGYRCASHNLAIGGAQESKHLFGIAADIQIVNAEDRYTITALAIQLEFKGIGIANTFVHVDDRTTGPRLWNYAK